MGLSSLWVHVHIYNYKTCKECDVIGYLLTKYVVQRGKCQLLASHLTSLGLSFLIYKKGIIIPVSEGVVRTNEFEYIIALSVVSGR